MPNRRPLPDTRKSITHKVKIDSDQGTHSLYITVGLYDDGTPGEVFVQIGKQGSSLRGFLDTVAIEMSMLLQYGVPLVEIVEQFRGTRFEPQGRTGDPDVPECSSVVDYIVRWLWQRFGEEEDA